MRARERERRAGERLLNSSFRGLGGFGAQRLDVEQRKRLNWRGRSLRGWMCVGVCVSFGGKEVKVNLESFS